MDRRAATLALLTTFLLAGCASEEGAPAAVSGDGSTASDGRSGSPASPSANDPGTQRQEALSLEGRTPVGGCAGTPVAGQCVNQAGEMNFGELGREGRVLRLEGTLSWSAASPATDTLGVLILAPHPNGGWGTREGLPYLYGQSPLAVDFDLAGIDEPLAVWITSYSGTGSQVGYAGVQVPQEFSFDAVVSSAQ